MNVGDVALPGLASRDCDNFTLPEMLLNLESCLLQISAANCYAIKHVRYIEIRVLDVV
jgi:hypothetical protein